ncbi:alpha/beta fold hydrolase [Agromyces sp. CFH 90414]|uniref:Alpha/beta fold hydrolase n=1 Tax=Agromyces agglutinans TaxID=2662258 RepID=A0A6I2F601_9MICO|nr:alpha/beta fold hydrolase [Agromyces agglutinans]MRG59721.1 alpha/beta fold hydrolase [Agromyces agglutinans]
MATFTDGHGVRIHYESWRVPEPTAVIQLVHGIGEHIGRYGELVEALNGAGYTVWADDHRGHGQTGFEQHGGDLTRMGRPGPGGMRAAIAGVERFGEIIREAEGDEVPLVILGHSWGSFMAQHVVNRHPDRFDAVVLSGTAWLQLGYTNLGDLNKRFARSGGTSVEWLSRDPAVARAFEADPYTTSRTLQQLFGWPQSFSLITRPSKLIPSELPLLILVGGDDPVAGERSALALLRDYVRRAHLVDAQLIVYEGARHEIFNETNRAEVRHDLIGWLDARFAVD